MTENSSTDRLIEIAYSAHKAGNFQKSEEYANRILELDSNNHEAWFLLGCAADSQTTLGNDRCPEGYSYFNKMFEILKEKPIENVSENIVDTLEELRAHIIAMTSAACSLYSQGLVEFPSEENLLLITNYFKNQLFANIAMVQTIEGQARSYLEKINELEASKSKEAITEKLSTLLKDLARTPGEMNHDAMWQLIRILDDSFERFLTLWNQSNEFSYSVEGYNDMSTEIENFNIGTEVSDRLLEVNAFIMGLIAVEETESYLKDQSKRIVFANSIRKLCGEEEAVRPDTKSDWLALAYRQRIAILTFKRDHRTYRRYFGQFANGALTSDGYTVTDEAKALINADLERFESQAWEHSPEKRAQDRRQQLTDRFWAEHPKVQDSINQTQEQITALKSDIAAVESDISALARKKRSLGFFARTQKNAICDQIKEKNADINNLKRSIKKLESKISRRHRECGLWVDKIIENEIFPPLGLYADSDIHHFIDDKNGMPAGFKTKDGEEHSF